MTVVFGTIKSVVELINLIIEESYSGIVESSAEGIYSSTLTNVRFLVEDWVL